MRQRPLLRSTLSTFTTGLLTGSLACPGIALADEPTDPANDDRIESTSTLEDDASARLPTVEVEASPARRMLGSPKFQQPIQDTPRTIQVLDAELLREQGATTLTEAMRNVPGAGTFFLGENGTTSTGDRLFLRGFEASGDIYVDGVRNLGNLSRDTFNVEQVEIFKGPASTDFGRSSPAGSFNLVSKRARLSDFTDLGLGVGNADFRRATVDLNRQLGASNAVRINLLGHRAGIPGRDVIENRRLGAAIAFGFGLDGDTRIHVMAQHVREVNITDTGVPTIGLPGYTAPPGVSDEVRAALEAAPPINPRNFYGHVNDQNDTRASNVSLIVEHALNADWDLTATTHFGRNREDTRASGFLLRNQDLIIPDPADRSTWQVRRAAQGNNQIESQILTQQVNLRGQFETGPLTHQISTGIEWIREERTRFLMRPDGTFDPIAIYNPVPAARTIDIVRSGAVNDARVTTVGAYLFNTVEAGRWLFPLGLRADRFHMRYQSTVLQQGQPAPGLDVDQRDTLYSWSAGVVFKATEDVSIYAQRAIAQQPPGGINLELSGSPASAANPQFKPQKTTNNEVGVKWNAWDRALLTAALFRTEVENEVDRDPFDPSVPITQDGRKRVDGFELGVTGRIHRRLQVTGAFSRQNARVSSGRLITAGDGSQDLPYTPKNAASLWITWDNLPSLSTSAGVRYVSGLKRGLNVGEGTPDGTDSYTLLDLAAAYRINPNASLRLNIDNVTNERYITSINRSGFRYQPGPERTVRIALDWRF